MLDFFGEVKWLWSIVLLLVSFQFVIGTTFIIKKEYKCISKKMHLLINLVGILTTVLIILSLPNIKLYFLKSIEI